MNRLISRRITVITGHYGCGKTEIAVNLAESLIREGSGKATLADMDIINPYFRSRELADKLADRGIRVIGGSVEDRLSGVPALSAAVRGELLRGSGPMILDVGGDPEGARLLGRYETDWGALIEKKELDVLYVVNPFRPETSDLEKLYALMVRIEGHSGLQTTGLVANGHLLKETGPKEVEAGIDLARRLEEKSGLPLRFAALPRGMEIPPNGLGCPTLPLVLHHRMEWMS